MECYYHPDRESTDKCNICGKSICKECGLEIAGKYYCKECIESIMGLNLDSNKSSAPEPKEEPIQNPTETPAQSIAPTPVFKDSATVDNPYQVINDESANTQKEIIPNEKQFGGETTVFRKEPELEEKTFKPIEEKSIGEIQKTPLYPEKPQEDRVYYPKEIPQEPSQYSEINNFDSVIQPNEKDYDIIYPDHSYNPPETSASKALESKYENYLDDLYFDEDVSLDEQLAKDEAKFGPLTKDPYVPIRNETQNYVENNPVQENVSANIGYNSQGASATGGVYANNAPQPNQAYPQDMGLKQESLDSYASLEDEIRRKLQEEEESKSRFGRKKKNKKKKENIHNQIPYQTKEKEPVGAVDIALSIILIIVVLIVVFYILYLLLLSTYYPTFLDAILALTDPQQLLSNVDLQAVKIK